MSLDIKALAITAAILWGGSVLLVGMGNLLFSGYGGAFLEMTASIYPGYNAAAGFGSVIVGTLYAALDGAIVGAIFAWLYNMVAARAT